MGLIRDAGRSSPNRGGPVLSLSKEGPPKDGGGAGELGVPQWKTNLASDASALTRLANVRQVFHKSELAGGSNAAHRS